MAGRRVASAASDEVSKRHGLEHSPSGTSQRSTTASVVGLSRNSTACTRAGLVRDYPTDLLSPRALDVTQPAPARGRPHRAPPGSVAGVELALATSAHARCAFAAETLRRRGADRPRRGLAIASEDAHPVSGTGDLARLNVLPQNFRLSQEAGKMASWRTLTRPQEAPIRAKAPAQAPPSSLQRCRPGKLALSRESALAWTEVRTGVDAGQRATGN